MFMICESNLEELKRSPLWTSTPLFYIKPFAYPRVGKSFTSFSAMLPCQ